MLQWLVGPIVELGKTWLKNKGEKQKAKHEAELKVIENSGAWEDTMAKGTVDSFKDEWFTIVLSLPLLAIIWGVALGDVEIIERTKQAFVVLGELPEYYQYLLYVAVLASFGIRGADKLMEMKK